MEVGDEGEFLLPGLSHNPWVTDEVEEFGHLVDLKVDFGIPLEINPSCVLWENAEVG